MTKSKRAEVTAALRLLTATIQLAEGVQDRARVRDPKQHPLDLVLFEVLVRQVRLAKAIHTLAPRFAYEAILQLRLMFEIWVNERWILLSSPHRRANRFIRHEVVDQMTALSELPLRLWTAHSHARFRALSRLRARIANIFRARTKKGRMRWEPDWGTHYGRETVKVDFPRNRGHLEM